MGIFFKDNAFTIIVSKNSLFFVHDQIIAKGDIMYYRGKLDDCFCLFEVSVGINGSGESANDLNSTVNPNNLNVYGYLHAWMIIICKMKKILVLCEQEVVQHQWCQFEQQEIVLQMYLTHC